VFKAPLIPLSQNLFPTESRCQHCALRQVSARSRARPKGRGTAAIARRAEAKDPRCML